VIGTLFVDGAFDETPQKPPDETFLSRSRAANFLGRLRRGAEREDGSLCLSSPVRHVLSAFTSTSLRRRLRNDYIIRDNVTQPMDNATLPLREDQQSYTLEWPTWSKYVVGDDGWLYQTGVRLLPARRFSDADDLVNAFAAINAVPVEDRARELLAFVKTFGLLGQTVLGGSGGRRRSRKRQGTTEQNTYKSGGRFYMADDVAWALQHSRNVARILRLYHRRWASLDEVLESLDERTVRVRPIGAGVAEPVVHPMTVQVPVLEPPWQRLIRRDALIAHRRAEPPLNVALGIVAELLNPNLVGVVRAYDAPTNMPTFRFRALIQLLYWQLADRLGHYAIRECRCGALFFVVDGRQGWHSTKCYRRFYMQEFRKGLRRRTRKRQGTTTKFKKGRSRERNDYRANVEGR